MNRWFSSLLIMLFGLTEMIGQSEKLEVSGSLRIGNDVGPTYTPGTIRWTGFDFEGFTGLFWLSLTHGQPLMVPGNLGTGQTLQVEGSIQIGSSSIPQPGSIRWTGGDFQGWNGVYWVSLTGNPVIDADGNTYPTTVIGTQEWMKQNLRTSKYADGSPIPFVTENSEWAALSTGGYCWYDNQNSNEQSYGKLYNWFAVVTDQLCPIGWRVPGESDWTTLENFLGGAVIAGGKMKETGLDHWNSPNGGATNSSDFTGIGGGIRSFNGSFNYQRQFGNFWSRNPVSTTAEAYVHYLNSSNDDLTNTQDDKKAGFSVRCIKQ